jgi:hypothetical protein
MQVIGKLLGVVLLAGLSLQMFGGNYGESYEQFKKNSMSLSEEDMHMLHDAFHINLHFTEAQSNDLITQIKGKVTSAQTQSSQVGSLITNTQSLIQFVKETKNAISNPGNLIKDQFSKIFGRNLLVNTAKANEVLASLESKVSEAKANQSTIDKVLESSTRFLQSLEVVKNLFSSKDGVWNKVKSFFGFSAAHLEKLAAQPVDFRGKRRLSLYQQQARSEKLFSAADKIKRALHYLNTTPENKLNVHDLERHLYDLIEEEGTLGRVYLRYVETLKCILLHQCEISNTSVTVTTDQGLENPTLEEIVKEQEQSAVQSQTETEGITTGETEVAENGQTVVVSSTPEEQVTSESEQEPSNADASLDETAVEKAAGGEESNQTGEVAPVTGEEQTTSSEDQSAVTGEESSVPEAEPLVDQTNEQGLTEGEAGTETVEEGPVTETSETNEEITNAENEQTQEAGATEEQQFTKAEEQQIIEAAKEEEVAEQIIEESAKEETTATTVQEEPVKEETTTETVAESQPTTEETTTSETVTESQPSTTETVTESQPTTTETVTESQPAKEETVVQNQSGVYEPVKNEQGEQQIPHEQEPTEQNPILYLGDQQVVDVSTGEVTSNEHINIISDSIFVQNESKDIIYPALTNILATPTGDASNEGTTAVGL